MAYNSFTYLFAFLGAVFLLYTVFPKRFKWVALLLGSGFFYWWSSKSLSAFLLLSALSVYLGGLGLSGIQARFVAGKEGLDKEARKALKQKTQVRKRLVVAAVLALNFGILIVLKYWNFLCGTADGIAGLFSGNFSFCYPVAVALPLGISFYTLEAAGYLIDVYRGKYPAAKNPVKVLLFLSFFPTVTEGPISRFDQLSEQLYCGHSFDYERMVRAVLRIFWGLFKKVVVADRAALLVQTVFKPGADFQGVTVVLAVLTYTLQLYAEFSGCMDIVSGSALLFGVELTENFRQPFFAGSINEFWRRWHITLGTWLKDYVFYSVSLSGTFMKLSKALRKRNNPFLANLVPAAFALVFVWLGNGFWHGSGWKYVVYGLYYYVLMMLGMVFEPAFRKLFSEKKLKRDGKLMRAFRIVRTFLIVNIGMMLFRANSLTAFGRLFAAVFRGSFFTAFSNGTLMELGIDAYDYIVILVGVIVMLAVSIFKEKGHDILSELLLKPIPVRWTVALLLILTVIVFGAYGDNYGVVAFIYGNF